MIEKILAFDNANLSSATSSIPHNTNFDVPLILNWVYGLAGLVAAGFIVYGAINYITANGDAGKATAAKQTITNAVIGLVLVLLAAAITNFIAGAIK